MKMTNLSLGFICAFFALFALINAFITKNNEKEAQIHQVAILLCKIDIPVANSCESITLHNMKHKFDNQEYWQEAKKIFKDKVKITELKTKVAKIEKFNNEIIKVEKQRLEQERKKELLTQIKNDFAKVEQ